MGLDIDIGLRLIAKAREKDRDDRIFQQWCVQLPTMAACESYMSFEDYRDRMTGSNIDRRPAAEILAELEAVESQFIKE